MDYGSRDETPKYSTLNVIINSLAFGITPIIAGWLTEWKIQGNFVYIGILSLCTIFILLLIKTGKIKIIYPRPAKI
jgi:hypothetical protein